MRKGKIKNSIVTIAMAMMLSVTAVVDLERMQKQRQVIQVINSIRIVI